MTKSVTICDKGWELYDEWAVFFDKKENTAEKNKDLDRKVASAWRMYKKHRNDCPNCTNVDVDV
jgi:hypothetical protein